LNQEIIYQLALPLVENIGDVNCRILLQHFNTASEIFKAKMQDLERIEGIGTLRARSIKAFKDYKTVEKEISFMEKYRIKKLFLTDENYPKRLLHCYDAPTLLFYKGEANLNASRMVGIVGTRTATDYGRHETEKIIEALAEHDVTIISGLAMGIDAIAHKAAIKNNIPTIGAIGHGLDTIYPASHAGLAKEMIKMGGGLLTEFFSGTLPEKHNFPLRNRIVAGLSDAVIVVETHVKGGSMITAKFGDSYNRDVFAIPGRNIDSKSGGCNYLIRTQKANMLTTPDDFLETMGWKLNKKKVKKQKELFMELNGDEKRITDLLEEKGSLGIDQIVLSAQLSSSAIAASLLNLELQGIIESLPGKIYRLL
jgi:DNA processing protein